MIYIMAAKQTRIPIDSLIFEHEVDLIITDPYYICGHEVNIDNDSFIKCDNMHKHTSHRIYAPENDQINGTLIELKSGIICVTTKEFAKYLCDDEDLFDDIIKDGFLKVIIIDNFKGKVQITKIINNNKENEFFIEIDLFSLEGKKLYHVVQTEHPFKNCTALNEITVTDLPQNVEIIKRPINIIVCRISYDENNNRKITFCQLPRPKVLAACD